MCYYCIGDYKLGKTLLDLQTTFTLFTCYKHILWLFLTPEKYHVYENDTAVDTS